MRNWIGVVFIAFGVGLAVGSGIGLVVVGLAADEHGINGLSLAGPLWIGALIAGLAAFIGLLLHVLLRRRTH